jgi:membrane protease YdiL (CAAX protease family)
MTAPTVSRPVVTRPDVTRPILLVMGLAGLIIGRWAAAVDGYVDPIPVGLAFGVALVGVAVLGGWRPERVAVRSVGVGLVGGAALVLVALFGRVTSVTPQIDGLSGASFALGPWAAATCLVALGEEAVLRGALLDRIAARFGLPAAVMLTSAAFALMHVPLYGWHVVPLDLGAGLWFAGLRLVTGGTWAPTVAHAVADLATYWL